VDEAGKRTVREKNENEKEVQCTCYCNHSVRVGDHYERSYDDFCCNVKGCPARLALTTSGKVSKEMKVHKKAHVDALRRRRNGSSSGTDGISEYNISFPYWLGDEINATSSNSSSSTSSGTIGGGSVATGNNTNGSTTKDQFSPAMSKLRAAQKVFKSTPRPLKHDECGWALRNKKLLQFRKQIARLEKRESVPAPKTDLAKKQLQHPSPREQRNFYEKGGIGELWIPNRMRVSFLREQQNALNNGGLGNTNGRA
jgi:hypothetical protein